MVAAFPPAVIPEIVVVPFAPLSLTLIAPTLAPKALAKVEVASTINASIKTCFVFTSISLMTASIVSRSGSWPLTIIDLVVSSTVILKLVIVAAPSAP